MKKILLMGNPNVGKSAFFSRLTGVDVVISNYSGTTVEYKKGNMKLGKEIAEVIDVPGTYTLRPTCKAEKVAVEMMKEGDVIINVVDSTNLERNLGLTLELLEKKMPVIVALNFWDETRHKGIDIDVKKLERLLGVPVVPTVGITGQGIKELVSKISKAKAHSYKYTDKKRWDKIGKIVKETQKIKHKHHTFLEFLEDLSIRPLTGIPLALLIMFLSIELVRFIGEGLIGYVFEPLFNLYLPYVAGLGAFLGKGIIHDILIGTLINGQIDFVQSMGLLTTGLFVPIAMVLPYVFAFYFILGFLEDSGYLPRLATLVDVVMHKIGMHGIAIIPNMLGFGCNVPGALSTRILESKRQIFIASTLIAIAIPCLAQIAMVFGLLGGYGIKGIGIVFGILFIVWFVLGFILNKFIKGTTPETFLEITPYRIPYFNALAKKLWMRIRYFITEAVPFVFLGVVFVNILYSLGIISFLSEVSAPVIVGVLGLPKEAVASLVVGFLRKDVAVGMLLPLGLSLKQLIIASVVLTMYFPCVATFAVMFKELGWKDMLKSVGIMIVSTLIVGGLLNIIL
ncbi:MAG: ferrous iron transporter B [Candidatus Aenigmarchaeota archaeon]|nr:ferrous iron transporter B [Candidatus Aenigmarchaeota archaeon]